MKTEVVVLVSDLEVLKTALNSAYYKCLSEDMGRAYNNLDSNARESALTKLLSDGVQKVDSYIEIAAEKSESEDG